MHIYLHMCCFFYIQVGIIKDMLRRLWGNTILIFMPHFCGILMVFIHSDNSVNKKAHNKVLIRFQEKTFTKEKAMSIGSAY